MIKGIIALAEALSQLCPDAADADFESNITNEGANKVAENKIIPVAIISHRVTGFPCPILAHKGNSFLLFIKRSPT